MKMVLISMMDEQKIKAYVSQLQIRCDSEGLSVKLNPQLFSDGIPNYWELKINYEQKLGASTMLKSIAQVAFVGKFDSDFKIVKAFSDAQENALVNMYNANDGR